MPILIPIILDSGGKIFKILKTGTVTSDKNLFDKLNVSKPNLNPHKQQQEEEEDLWWHVYIHNPENIKAQFTHIAEINLF